MDNSNEINFSTQQIEKLWADLSQVWPALKNNPDIAEKIEKLWDVLKATNSIPLALDIEIQNLLNENATLTSMDVSSTATIQADQNLDSLLAEILGENYQNESPSINNNQDIAPPLNINSDTEELDKLVASILGDDWLNEDATKNRSYDDNKSQLNIDSLVSSIIEGEIEEDNNTLSTEKPYTGNEKFIADKQDIDELLNEILNESDTNEELATHSDKAEESVDYLTHEALNKEPDFSNIASTMSDDEKIAVSEEQEENIDDLIYEVLNKETDFTNTESDFSNEENIDILIHEVLNKETSHKKTALGLNKDEEITTDNEENIDNLIYEILKDEPDTNSLNDDLDIEKADSHSNEEEPSHQENYYQPTKKITSSQKIKKKEPKLYKQDKKQNSNALIIAILIILILLISGAWKLFFSKEDTATKKENTRNQPLTTELKPKKAYQPSISGEHQLKKTPKQSSPETEEKPTTDSSIYYEDIKPKYNSPVTEENATDDTSIYYGGIEQNEEDITITLNSPETAIESNGSTIFTENKNYTAIKIDPVTGNNINTLEKITPPPLPADKQSEHVKPEKTTKKGKTTLKRKTIIHKIVKGDTLWAIAKRYVSNPYRYRELAKLSKIKNPDRIYPGNKVKIVVYVK